MRYQTVLGVALCLGAFSPGFAADPPATSSAPAQATAASSDTSTAAATATTPPASDKAAADAALVAQTHRLRSAGYKPKVKDGTTLWCRPETALGSRLSQVERCGTPEQIDQSVRDAKESVEKMQKNVTQRQSN